MGPVWTVYSHTHVASGRRYVGLTKKTMLFRWNQHVYSAERKAGKGCAHFWAAIRKYGKDAFSHEVLETCDTLEAANAAEDRWIEQLGTRDPERGFNLMRGGEHTPHPIKNPWDRPEYREKGLLHLVGLGQDPITRAKQKASLNTPESKRKRSVLSRALIGSPDMRAKLSDMARESNSRPEVKAKISKAHLGHVKSPETRAKLSAAARGRVKSPETRAKSSAALKGRVFTPEHRMNMSIAQTGKTLSPETRAKIGDSHRGKKLSPEHRAALSASQKGRVLSPEVYAKIAASCKATRERKASRLRPLISDFESE